MSGTTPPNLTNAAIAAAKDLPTLYANLQAVDPALAAQLTGGATTATMTPISTAVVGGLVWLSTKYGLNWDQHFCEILVLVGGAAAGYISHWLASCSKKAAIAAAPTA